MLRCATSAMMRRTFRMSASLNSSEMRRPLYSRLPPGPSGGGGGTTTLRGGSSAAGAGGAESVERTRLLSGMARGLGGGRSEEHTSELQAPNHLLCPPLLVKKKKNTRRCHTVQA